MSLCRACPENQQHITFASRGSQIPASYGKRGCSPDMESLLAGTTGGSPNSPKQEPPAKRRRLSKEEQPLHRLNNENNSEKSSDAVRDGQASAESLEWESKCVVALATEVCRVNGKGRKECQGLHEVHALKLLNRYRAEMRQPERYVHSYLRRYSLLTVSTHWQGLRKGTATQNIT